MKREQRLIKLQESASCCKGEDRRIDTNDSRLVGGGWSVAVVHHFDQSSGWKVLCDRGLF